MSDFRYDEILTLLSVRSDEDEALSRAYDEEDWVTVGILGENIDDLNYRIEALVEVRPDLADVVEFAG